MKFYFQYCAYYNCVVLQELEQKQMKKAPVWWPFTDMSKKAIAFLIIWPFIVTLLLQSVQRRKT